MRYLNIVGEINELGLEPWDIKLTKEYLKETAEEVDFNTI